MTDAAKYVTEEAVQTARRVENELPTIGNGISDEDFTRAELEAAAPHIIAAVVAEAAEGRGPAAAAAYRWAATLIRAGNTNRETLARIAAATEAGFIAKWLAALADQADAGEEQTAMTVTPTPSNYGTEHWVRGYAAGKNSPDGNQFYTGYAEALRDAAVMIDMHKLPALATNLRALATRIDDLATDPEAGLEPIDIVDLADQAEANREQP